MLELTNQPILVVGRARLGLVYHAHHHDPWWRRLLRAIWRAMVWSVT